MIDVSVTCPYCQNAAQLITGATIYPHRLDLHDKRFWQCAPCDAYVGCHPGTRRPLGRLANAELRAAKIAAHAAFDPLWQSSWMKRNEAYTLLAQELGIRRQSCHIGNFSLTMCRKVVEICNNYDFQSG